MITIDTFAFTHAGIEFSARVVLDEDHGAPWDTCDGHGPVSDWRPLGSKRPGERLLYHDGRHARFYDWAEAMRIARREGWRHSSVLPTDTPGQRAEKAVRADFEYLRAWCDNDWYYVGVIVTLPGLDADVANTSLWGIESNATDYLQDVAQDLAAELIACACDAIRTEVERLQRVAAVLRTVERKGGDACASDSPF